MSPRKKLTFEQMLAELELAAGEEALSSDYDTGNGGPARARRRLTTARRAVLKKYRSVVKDAENDLEQRQYESSMAAALRGT